MSTKNTSNIPYLNLKRDRMSPLTLVSASYHTVLDAQDEHDVLFFIACVCIASPTVYLTLRTNVTITTLPAILFIAVIHIYLYTKLCFTSLHIHFWAPCIQIICAYGSVSFGRKLVKRMQSFVSTYNTLFPFYILIFTFCILQRNF